MKNIYFISDIHLAFKESEFELKKRKNLLDFLTFVREEGEAKELFLVGDIFDFWFEWYHVVPKYWFPILYEFRRLVEAGIEVNFITGNHDFYTGTYLQKEVGIRCFDESMAFDVGEKRFFVAHGDGYAKEDRGYRFLKKVIRNPLSIFLFKTFFPADWGMQLAYWASHSSRQMVKIEKHSWADEYYHFAENMFKQGFHYVVMGHIHFPTLKETENGENAFLNCGDWMTQFTYGKYDGEKLTLNYWQK
jgi:UDP-2,3-diacylglucosamine hydrolase